MTNRREACITFQRMTRAQLPPSEYNILRQLFQKLISGLSNAKDVHEAICAILRRHNATELLALFERLVTMGTTETSLRLLRQPCGVHVSEGAPMPLCPKGSSAPPACVSPAARRCRTVGAAASGPFDRAFRQARLGHAAGVRGEPRASRSAPRTPQPPHAHSHPRTPTRNVRCHTNRLPTPLRPPFIRPFPRSSPPVTARGKGLRSGATTPRWPAHRSFRRWRRTL